MKQEKLIKDCISKSKELSKSIASLAAAVVDESVGKGFRNQTAKEIEEAWELLKLLDEFQVDLTKYSYELKRKYTKF